MTKNEIVHCTGPQEELLSGYPVKAILTGYQERLLAVARVLERLG
jgi:hypothetical protein